MNINDGSRTKNAQYDALKRFIKDLEEKTLADKQHYYKEQMAKSKGREFDRQKNKDKVL